MTKEIKERLSEELDYEHEAQSHRAIARAWRGHPFIYVPEVLTRLSSEHVLVTEWVDGIGFEEVRTLERATRDRFGEIVFRFFFGSLYRNGHFSGDPHPGNQLLMPDGRVAFLDFGMTKKLPREQIDAEIAAIRSGLEGDAERFHAQMAQLGYFDVDDERIAPDALLEQCLDAIEWYRDDRELTLDREVVSRVLVDAGDPRSRHWELMKHQTLPPETLLARRMEALTLGVLGRVEATANWHRIAREWLFGDPPATPLGEQEAEYFGGRRRAA